MCIGTMSGGSACNKVARSGGSSWHRCGVFQSRMGRDRQGISVMSGAWGSALFLSQWLKRSGLSAVAEAQWLKRSG
jgi:hypothetical protein